MRMAKWPQGLGHRSCPQLYFMLDVSYGHLTQPFRGLEFLCLLMGMITALRYLEDKKWKKFLQHFIIKYRTRQTPPNFVIIQIDKYRAGCTESLLCFPSVNVIASDKQCGMRRKKKKRGKRNNFKLV